MEDVAMRNYDFTSLWRSTVGFDHLFELVAGRYPVGPDQEFIYQGISERPFERRFSLADHLEVEQAAFENGLLHIDLVRKVPEAMKPRRIEINADSQVISEDAKPMATMKVVAA
jgi:hypothetical protein